MQRERLGSRLGFILLSAGCAIGIGNVWKFPYMVGQNGGGAFVLIYLFFLLVLGIPVMTIEFSLGRASQKSPVRLYQQLEPKGSKWHYHGYVALSGNYLLMMFYTTIGGWMLIYFFKMVMGEFVGRTPDEVAGIFNGMLTQPVLMGVWMGIVVLLGFGVCLAVPLTLIPITVASHAGKVRKYLAALSVRSRSNSFSNVMLPAKKGYPWRVISPSTCAGSSVSTKPVRRFTGAVRCR